MSDYADFFRGKKVTVIGLGLLGRGIGDVRFLARAGATLTVTDLKTKEELAPSLEVLKDFPDITYVLGEHRDRDFTEADIVIKAAGVPLHSRHVEEARKAGVPVYMSTALFAEFARKRGAVLVGITGTRGKSTVAHMIYHGLKTVMGLNRALGAVGRTGLRGKPVLGGNIRGHSTLEMLPDIQSGDLVVLELDSWQLQGFGDLQISPDVAVFTNLMPDHLNYYGGDMAKYFWDKANIFIHQKSGNKLVVGSGVLSKIQSANPPVAPVVPPLVSREWTLKLIGEHNKENAALAVLALKILGLNDEEVRAGVESFEPVEGRLQKMPEIKGISIYNDNNASTPEATIAGIRALRDAGPLTLIAGGTEKNVDVGPLAQEIDVSLHALVLFAGSGTEQLKKLLHKKYQETNSLSDALAKALAITPVGGTILFSPAFASFGPFVNYYDRNDQFVAAVKALA